MSKLSSPARTAGPAIPTRRVLLSSRPATVRSGGSARGANDLGMADDDGDEGRSGPDPPDNQAGDEDQHRADQPVGHLG